MKIAFFRHGESLSIQESGVTLDSERLLSEVGKNQVLQSLQNLKNENFTPEAILSSPYKRAKQTSEIISNFYNCNQIIFIPELAQSSDFKNIINLIKLNSSGKNTIVVGHQPTLGIISEIITGKENITIKTAGYALIKIQDSDQFIGILESNFNL